MSEGGVGRRPVSRIVAVSLFEEMTFVLSSVQLRPTVKPMGKALEYDVSLLERLYTSNAHPGTVKTMLNVSGAFNHGILGVQLDMTLPPGAIPIPERTGSLPVDRVLQRTTSIAYPGQRASPRSISRHCLSVAKGGQRTTARAYRLRPM